jgi:DnaD/phage-associated family protein
MADVTPTTSSEHKFTGFPAGVTMLTELPEPFFTDLLPIIDDLAELKITLYAMWYIQQLDGDIRYMRLSEMQKDPVLKQALTIGLGEDDFLEILQSTLQKAVKRGTLLLITEKESQELYYFINTPRSQAILDGYHKGEWHPEAVKHQPIGLDLDKPDVFKLYEQNIGLITPMIADQLKLASDEFPIGWIKDAMQIAVENNVRRWSYINRILQSWQERGRNAKN